MAERRVRQPLPSKRKPWRRLTLLLSHPNPAPPESNGAPGHTPARESFGVGDWRGRRGDLRWPGVGCRESNDAPTQRQSNRFDSTRPEPIRHDPVNRERNAWCASTPLAHATPGGVG